MYVNKFLRMPLMLLFVLLTYVSAECAEKESRLHAVGRKPSEVDFLNIDEGLSSKFESRDGETFRVAPEELVCWGAFRDHCDRPQIFLTDGSVIVADILSATDRELVFQSALFGLDTLSIAEIAAINLEPKRDDLKRDAQVAKLLARHSSSQFARDTANSNADVATSAVVMLNSGDQIEGRLVSIDPAERNRIRKVTVSVDETELKLQMVRVQAIRLHQRDFSHDARIAIGFSDGSLLYVKSLTNDGDGNVFTLASGARVRLSKGKAKSSNPIVFLQSLVSKASFLSDLTPLSEQQVSMLGTRFDLVEDRCVTGTRLRCDQSVYLRGLGMHATASAAYAVPADRKWFAAEIAIDQSAANLGSVVFKVFVLNSQNSWESVYESQVVGGGAPALPIRVKLPERKTTIALAVDQASDGDQMDRAVWLNARLE